MPMNISCILLIVALIVTIMAGMGKAPVWVGVLLINVAALLNCLPK